MLAQSNLACQAMAHMALGFYSIVHDVMLLAVCISMQGVGGAAGIELLDLALNCVETQQASRLHL